MTAPVFTGMPTLDRIFEIGHWGSVRCGGRCKDDYARIVIYHDAGRLVMLQHAAMDSFQSAEREAGTIVLTGSHRACTQQRSLWLSDPQRFANPDATFHCRGLAIDVSTAQTKAKLAKIHSALSARHWHQSRPTDEPWHWSFGLSG